MEAMRWIDNLHGQSEKTGWRPKRFTPVLWRLHLQKVQITIGISKHFGPSLYHVNKSSNQNPRARWFQPQI